LNLQQFKVIQGRRFWYQSKAHMRLLIVIHGNFGPIHAPFLRYGDLLAENCVFFYYTRLLFGARSLSSLSNFAMKLSVRKLESLLCGEGCMILTSTVYDLSTRVTDRQTDG